MTETNNIAMNWNPYQLQTDYVYNVNVIDSIAYVATDHGLQRFDVSDPKNPILLDAISTDANAVRVGDVAYIADGYNGLQIVDVSQADTSTLLSTFDSEGYAYDVAVANNVAYIADDYNGVQLIDVSDPKAPVLLSSIDGTENSGFNSVAVVGNIAFVGDYYSGLRLIDVSNVNAPKELAIVSKLTDYVNNVSMVGDVAYLSTYNSVQLLDVSNPNQPVLLEPLSPQHYAWTSNPYVLQTNTVAAVTVSGNIAYLLDNQGLKLVDVSDAANPALLGRYDTNSSYASYYNGDQLIMNGDVAYVVNTYNGIQLIDVSDTNQPSAIGVIDMSEATAGNYYINDAQLDGDKLYVRSDSKMQIFDVSQADTPSLVSSLDLSENPDNAIVNTDVENQIIYQVSEINSDGNMMNSLTLLDVSNAKTANSLGSLLLGEYTGYVYDITVTGNIAYLTDGANLSLIDVSDTANPQLLSTFEPSIDANHVTVSGNTAYLRDYYGNLALVDVSDSRSPTLMANFSASDSINNVSIVGNTAYLAANSAGLNIVDLSPTTPEMLSSFNTQSYTQYYYYDYYLKDGAVADGNTGSVVTWVRPNVDMELIGAETTGNQVNGTGNALDNVITGNTDNNILRGLAGNDTLNGGGGDDRLNGGKGSDVLQGGAGSDSYFVDNRHDKISETSSKTIDSVTSTVNWTLGDNLEKLTLSGKHNLDGNGNALANTLIGNSGNNHLFGYAGNDTLSGSKGGDTLSGAMGDDHLNGGRGDDALLGNMGKDTLSGGFGKDKLTGGDGADCFAYASEQDSTLNQGAWDVISDFQSGRDKIDLHLIDANSNLKGNQAFVFIGAASEFNANIGAGQLRFDTDTHILYASTDADSRPEFAVQLNGVNTLQTSDLVL